MYGRKGRQDMVFGGAYVTLGKVCPVVIRGYVLYETGRGRRAKEGLDFRGGLIVGNEVGDGMVVGGEEIKYMFVSFSIGQARLVRHSVEVSVALVNRYKYVLVACSRLDWESPCQV